MFLNLELKDAGNNIQITLTENKILIAKPSNNSPNYLDQLFQKSKGHELNLAILEIQSTGMKLYNYKSKGMNCKDLQKQKLK